MVNQINAVLYYGNTKIKPRRMTILDRYRLWKRRRVMDDLAGVNGRA